MRDLTFLFAPPAYWRLTEEERKRHRCGPGRGVLEKLVPENLLGCSVSAACSIHDFCYAIGHTIEDKNEADRIFLNNMIRLIEAYGGLHFMIHLRLRRAFIYYEAVCHFGGPAFWREKNKPTELGLV